MRTSKMLAVLLLALALSACGGSRAAVPINAPAPAATMGPAAADQTSKSEASQPGRAIGESGAAAPAAPPAQDAQQNAQQYERLVIKNAQMTLQVQSVRDAESALRTRINELGGYVIKAESQGTDEQARVTISFRVPAVRFDEALSGAQGLAQKVVSRTISGDDVTEEFVDLQSRLKNLEATRDRLLTFLDKATKVEDALAVNNSLSEIQGQIEQIRGRMQFLKQNAALSSIVVTLLPVPTTPIVTEGAWQPLEVARGALRDLLELGQGLVNLAIVILIWTPLWLPLLLLGRWGMRRLRGRKPAAPAEAPKPMM